MKDKIFGLVGRNISYSFSAGYFTTKFKELGLKKYSYTNFDIENVDKLKKIIKKTEGLRGLNVTIPYKEEVIPLLNKLSKNAEIIGAVNTITVSKKGKTKGYNTDYYGFKKALEPLLLPHHTKALILGTGGASKAVAYALRKMMIEYDFVSRTGSETVLVYDELDADVFADYQIIINTSPVGTFPDVDDCPPLDYTLFTENHIAFDLVYNPAETKFLRLAKQSGADTENGYAMLIHQAEKAWEIWNK